MALLWSKSPFMIRYQNRCGIYVTQINACDRKGELQIGTASVAIVVNSFNDLRFLPDALASIFAQSVSATEVVVVDDGSSESPEEWLRSYPQVHLIRQHNRGLAAARNLGLASVSCDYVIFLDADDRLLPNAIAAGLACFSVHPEAQMVYGGHRRVDAMLTPLGPDRFSAPAADAYTSFLRGNLVAMHATAMYRTATLRSLGGFDPALRTCEDYDLYLRLTRCHAIAWHGETVAEYRRHGANISRDPGPMLAQVLAVLDRHGGEEQVPARRAAWLEGRRNWQSYYAGAEAMAEAKRTAGVGRLRSLIAAPFRLARRVKRGLRRDGAWPPPLGRVRLGDLGTTRPVSMDFGFDRGLPIDRYYIEAFLAAHAADIAGRVLEIGDDSYSRRFGGAAIIRQDVLHIDQDHPGATLVGDLIDPAVLPDETFDCIVLTQTLQFVFDHAAAMRCLYAALRPGGVLLLTVPGITPVERGRWGDMWFWSFTETALSRMAASVFGDAACLTETQGNVFAATAMLQGLAVEEVDVARLAPLDRAYPVIVSLRARKPER